MGYQRLTVESLTVMKPSIGFQQWTERTEAFSPGHGTASRHLAASIN
jgi:hypothetical protein